MHPLKLTYSLTNYGQFSSRKGNKAFQQLAKKIFARDKNVCQFCGFQAKKYQEVVNLDRNYRNNKPENLVTACCFCTQTMFLESVGEQGYGGGIVIYFPELPQNALNALCHVLFFSIASNSAEKDSAQSLLQTFRIRAGVVDKLLGEGMSDPALLGRLLLDFTGSRKDPRVELILKDLRLLPARGRFQKQIEYWVQQAGGS